MKNLSLFVVVLLTLCSDIYANNLPPLASFVDDVNRGFFFAGEIITFDGSGSIDQDEGGSSITRYRWTVDGVTLPESTSPTLSTSFNLTSGQNVKTVQITLEVRDDELTWSGNEEKMTKTYTVRRGQDRHFYLKDHLGSVRVTVDEAGDPIGFDDYYPYGLQMPTRSSNLSNPNDAYKYTGHERDTEAGLTFDYMGARTYDPMLGTFMQIDPLMEFATPYSYVGGNPVNLTDPTGMSSCKDAKGDPVLFSAAEADPCDPSSETAQEIKQEEASSENPPDLAYAIKSGFVQLNDVATLAFTYNYKTQTGKLIYFSDGISMVIELGEEVSFKGLQLFSGQKNIKSTDYFSRENAGVKKILPEVVQMFAEPALSMKDVYNNYVDASFLNEIKGFNTDAIIEILSSTDLDFYSKRITQAENNFKVVKRINQERIYGKTSSGMRFVFETRQIKEYHN